MLGTRRGEESAKLLDQAELPGLRAFDRLLRDPVPEHILRIGPPHPLGTLAVRTLFRDQARAVALEPRVDARSIGEQGPQIARGRRSSGIRDTAVSVDRRLELPDGRRSTGDAVQAPEESGV